MSAQRTIWFFLLLPILWGCQQDRKSGPWLPVLEPTGFSHLEETVARGLESVERAEADLTAGNLDGTLGNLRASRHALLALRHYFVPMTQARQLIYDADRLWFLGRREEAIDNLNQARTILAQVGAAGGAALANTLDEAETMLDQLLLKIDQAPADLPERFQSLGHKVNMLAIKGDLVLAGVRFAEER